MKQMKFDFLIFFKGWHMFNKKHIPNLKSFKEKHIQISLFNNNANHISSKQKSSHDL
jgi:hypothetical protein